MPNPFLNPISTTGLRKCQREAYEAILTHFKDPSAERHVIVQLPTGTGKTGLMAAMPFALCEGKVLILTPGVKLSKDIEKELDIVKNPQNIYARLGIVPPADLEKLEMYVLRLEGTISETDIDEHQIIVANYHQLQDVEKWFRNRREAIDLIIIDEAHHQSADTYQEVIRFFDGVKIVGMTATPFRSDGKEVGGKNVYTYHFHEAIHDHVIRNIRTSNVTPEQIQLSFSDQEGRTYSLDEILKLSEEAWFSRGIALSADCCSSIARKALEKLQALRTEFPQTMHQIIASAISVRHAREFVKPAFEQLGLQVGLVSSHAEDRAKNDEVFEKLKQGKIDVIIHIGMLGEGFDHPPLGVAAIFRPYKSLNPYIQFIGRVIRRNGPTAHCYVVSHLGLNQHKRFDEFRLFDHDDKGFIQEVLEEQRGTQPEDASFVQEDELEGDESDFEAEPVRISEIGTDLVDFETQYVKEDQKVEALHASIEGLTDEGKRALFEKMGIDYDKVTIKSRGRSKPVDLRKASRNLLNEREKSVATDILKKLALKHRGRDFTPMYDNFTWVKKKVSKEVNRILGMDAKQRKLITNSQFNDIEAQGALQKVGATCADYFVAKLQEKRGQKRT